MYKLALFLFLSVEVLVANAHIFVYHRFGDSKHASTNTTINELKEQFEFFKKNGYEVVKLTQIVEKIEKKEKIPDNWVALTIDDSYKSFFENGLKYFKQYNYPFTLYVYVEATQRRFKDFMSWDELKEVAKHGDLGLHSYGHPKLTKISINDVLEDTKKGIELFEKSLGFSPTSYAYPYGEYNQQVQNAIQSLGFRYICNQNSGAVASFSDKYDIDRIAIVGKTNLKQLLKMKPLNATWGEIKREKNTIKSIKLHLPSGINKGELYVSGHNWERVKVDNSELNINKDYKLKLDRTRVIFKTYNNEQTAKIIIK